jgi:hypothetical protein
MNAREQKAALGGREGVREGYAKEHGRSSLTLLPERAEVA